MVEEIIHLGHTMIGCGRNKTEIALLKRRHGVPHCFSALDIASDEQVKCWSTSVFRSYGAPDLVLNNAGVINRNAPLWKITAQEFSRVLDVNVRGTANVIRRFLPAMLRQRRGVIVNFSSGWGRSTDPEVAPYCASKWGIEGLTQALAQELPPGLAAVSLNPGIIDTRMLRSCFGKAAGSYIRPAEWARKAVPFLLKLGPADNGKQLQVQGVSERRSRGSEGCRSATTKTKAGYSSARLNIRLVSGSQTFNLRQRKISAG